MPVPVPAEVEVHTIHGRTLNVRWKSSRHGEWLAWCYVPAPSMMPNEGVGFEARAESPEAAKAALLEKVSAHLSK